MDRRILILSGPTHEYIDPVRFIGNASSGLMGKAIAEEATRRGFTVDFITGPVCDANLPELTDTGSIHRVVSANEMLETARPLFDMADAVVFAAAVADYKPAEKQEQKRGSGEKEWMLRLSPNPDIAKTLCANKREGQIAIGFALQTHDAESNACRKLVEKNLDGIVLNSPSSLGAPDGTFSFLSVENDAFESWGNTNKTDCAKRILDRIGIRLQP